MALLTLDTAFFLLEAIIGYTVHSLALIADSFHMLNDIISLLIAWWAVRVKDSKPADGKYTYGWQRAEILGALVNAVFLIALCFSIVIEAILRFFEPQEISNPSLVLIVGIAGLASNGLGLVLFHEHGHSHGHSHLSDVEESVGDHEHGHSHSHDQDTYAHSNESSSSIGQYLPDRVVDSFDERSTLLKNKGAKPKEHEPKKKTKLMNMEGVFLHVLGDALGNIGVIITGIFIWKTDYSWRFYLDPVVSLLITAIIFSSALPLCMKACKILLQATPPNVDSNRIVKEIMSVLSIKSVHDFHVWNLNEDYLISSLHVEFKEQEPVSHQDTEEDRQCINKAAFVETVSQVRAILHRFGIDSVTIQPEFASKKPSSVYGATTTTTFQCS